MRVLIVEDDNRFADALAGVLMRHGFAVYRAGDGATALELLGEVDVVLLDLGLPDVDGFDVCRRIRAASDVPVIMLTARAEHGARIRGLDLGADDYLVKPVHGGELVARLHAVTRRGGRTGSPARAAAPPEARVGAVRLGRLDVDPAARRVHVDGREVPLTRKEFDLLAVLAREPGLVYRREQIIAEVWGTHSDSAQRTLEVHVASLRAKLGVPELIDTVRGVGYRVQAG